MKKLEILDMIGSKTKKFEMTVSGNLSDKEAETLLDIYIENRNMKMEWSSGQDGTCITLTV